MSHTNSTPNYNLPQFLTTDKPFWLTDINGAFLAIDTGIDAAKNAADNAQNDATQAITDAGNASTAAATADAKGSGAVASIAEAFDATAAYVTGDIVMYNSLLYICISSVGPSAWTGATNWSRITVGDKLESIKSDIDTINNLQDLSSQVTLNTGFTVPDWGAVKLYRIGNICIFTVFGLTAANNVTSDTYMATLPVTPRTLSCGCLAGYIGSTDRVGSMRVAAGDTGVIVNNITQSISVSGTFIFAV